MWQPTLDVTAIGPATYRFTTPSPPALPDETEFVIQDVDPQDQPIIHNVAGQASIEYTFPRAGQFRVTVRTYRTRPDIPGVDEFGTAGQIIRIAAPEPETPADPDPGPLPDDLPEPEPDETPKEEPMANPSGDRLIELAICLGERLLEMEMTQARAFVLGLVAGTVGTYAWAFWL
ncbi:hypothetical protein [Methanoculleus sp. UBA208]|uniref:hypothetical protein n=1 Tax=Methanoculleus sp. UBA208 TaxID=1915494 RepID=UPI0025D00BA0|nr:hypothetical protein [Methanoculleus sp. UBA208]